MGSKKKPEVPQGDAEQARDYGQAEVKKNG